MKERCDAKLLFSWKFFANIGVRGLVVSVLDCQSRGQSSNLQGIIWFKLSAPRAPLANSAIMCTLTINDTVSGTLRQRGIGLATHPHIPRLRNEVANTSYHLLSQE